MGSSLVLGHGLEVMILHCTALDYIALYYTAAHF